MMCPRCGHPVSTLSDPCPTCGAGAASSPTVVVAPASSRVAAGWTAADQTTAGPAPLGADDVTIGAGKPRARDTGPLAPGQTFGPRYHIIRLLGAGGMGAVYQAWDAELGVAVAIKVIRPEIMADPEAAADMEKRFKRELLLARQVTHKNV